jgi:hypothetical protein
MVMIVNEPEIEPALEALLDEEDQCHDGWTPVRLRRSSMPVPLSAADAAHAAEPTTQPETHAKPLNG